METNEGEPNAANESGLEALGRRIDASSPMAAPKRGRRRHSRWSRWSTRRKILTVVGSFLALVLVLAGALYGYLNYVYGKIQKTHVASEVAASGPAFNMLVIGSDSRAGTSSSAFGSASVVTGQRSDVVMIWHVDPGAHQISIISIPRDTLVQMVGSNVSQYGRMNRINASYDSGPNLLVQTIENNFGIPINHVLQVNFNGFMGAVNALGGVYLNFPYPAKDAYSGLNITSPGCQLLNGTAALSVARSRHYEYFANGQWQGDGSSDFGRIQRQDAFIKSLIDAAKSKRNPLTINAFLSEIPKGVVIDDQMSLNEMIGLGIDFHGFNPNALTTFTMPTTSNGYVAPWGDVLFVDQPSAQQLFTQVFGNELTTPTAPPPNTSLVPTPPPAVTPTTTAPTSHGTGTGSAPTSTVPPPPSFDPTPCNP